ncbi:MAG: PEP-CTERM sorting domain-containing protein [Akkermansia sp.]|nr:PEP-CTERM sorting domain-containing protein [Akkermansia sp.]
MFQGKWSGARTLLLKTMIVPEPTTATLSLLALAGLAARRRRRG